MIFPRAAALQDPTVLTFPQCNTLESTSHYWLLMYVRTKSKYAQSSTAWSGPLSTCVRVAENLSDFEKIPFIGGIKITPKMIIHSEASP